MLLWRSWVSCWGVENITLVSSFLLIFLLRGIDLVSLPLVLWLIVYVVVCYDSNELILPTECENGFQFWIVHYWADLPRANV